MHTVERSACSQDEAVAVMESAAAAMGVLHVIRTHVMRTEYWREQYHASEAPAFMLLLNAIMTRQPLLHGQACSHHRP